MAEPTSARRRITRGVLPMLALALIAGGLALTALGMKPPPPETLTSFMQR